MAAFIFDTVYKLAHATQPIPFTAIPKPLYNDFITFMTGKSIVKIDGVLAAYPNDYRAWIDKLATKGVDYEIDLSQNFV